MKIALCGSIKFIDEMKAAKIELERLGHEVLIPYSAEANQGKEFWEELKKQDVKNFVSLKKERMRGHFDKVKKAAAILVLNYDKDGKKNYIGPNTFLEMAIAFDHGKKIFILNPVSENDPRHEELITMSPICIDTDFEKIE